MFMQKAARRRKIFLLTCFLPKLVAWSFYVFLGIYKIFENLNIAFESNCCFFTAVALHFHALVIWELSWENPQYISNKHFKPSKTILKLSPSLSKKKDVTLQILKFPFKPHSYINTNLNEASLLKWNGISRLLRPNSSKNVLRHTHLWYPFTLTLHDTLE